MKKMKPILFLCLFTMALPLIFTSSVRAAGDGSVVFTEGDSSSDYVGIVIDGNFRDWDDKPETRIIQGGGNKYEIAALFRDDTFVYLRINMATSANDKFVGNNYHFVIDGVDFPVEVRSLDGGGIKAGKTPLAVYPRGANSAIEAAEGYVSHSDGIPDQWEIRIPLSYFSGSPETVRTIEFNCPHLGDTVLTATGTPTLPFIIAGAGLVIASSGVVISRRKRRK